MKYMLFFNHLKNIRRETNKIYDLIKDEFNPNKKELIVTNMGLINNKYEIVKYYIALELLIKFSNEEREIDQLYSNMVNNYKKKKWMYIIKNYKIVYILTKYIKNKKISSNNIYEILLNFFIKNNIDYLNYNIDFLILFINHYNKSRN